MNDKKTQHLINTLNNEGMTVLLTRDHNAIMLELAMLQRFDRLIRKVATVDGQLAVLVKRIDADAAALRQILQRGADVGSAPTPGI